MKDFDTIESLCSAFLWSGSPNVTSKAKVAWSDVCKPKREGGLGIRKLKDISKMFALKLIWCIVSNSGSLWGTWTRHYLLRYSSFWDAPSGTRGSWIWKKLLKLRPQSEDFFKYVVGNGESTFFWLDKWLELGRLIDVIGEVGTRNLGIDRMAKVADVVVEGNWRIRRSRSPRLVTVIQTIMNVQAPSSASGPDKILWRHAPDIYKANFSSKATWNQIREVNDEIWWHKLAWFQHAIPRQAFITWLALKDKLATGSRMRGWGIQQSCTLCGEIDETRDHLFFACPFSFMIWFWLTSRMINPNPDWEIAIRNISSSRRKDPDNLLLKLALQASIHTIWKERNDRRHNKAPRTAINIAHHIYNTIDIRIQSLRSLTQEQRTEIRQRWSMAVSIPFTAPPPYG